MGRATSRRRFRPRFLPTLAVVLLLPLLLYLGFWQLDRAREKRDLIIDFETGNETISLSGESGIARLGELARYQRVRITGRFDSGHQFLIDNMTDGGSAGYYVLTPLQVDGATTGVLINRGWVPRDFSATSVPDVSIDETPRQVVGRVARLPRPGLELPESDSSDTWPAVVQFPRMDELAEKLQRDLVPVSVLLDADSEGGYLRRWRPVEFGPDRHVGYAVQWFALALTLLIIYIVVNLKRGNDG